jgi:hypothetical protein
MLTAEKGATVKGEFKINWQFFPKSRPVPPQLLQVVAAFDNELPTFTAHYNLAITDKNLRQESNKVLASIAPHLKTAGFEVESEPGSGGKLRVGVLWGRNGRRERAFEADAVRRDPDGRLTIVEVEAGGGVANNLYLKDLFEACMMPGADYLAIAVRNRYKSSNDFDKVVSSIETIYTSDRLSLPLRGVLIIGY